jgi:hypothetical protein
MCAQDTHKQKQSSRFNFRQQQYRRRKSLFRKGVEYSDIYQADVYLIIQVNNQYFILNTNSSGTWPPSGEQIVSVNLHLYVSQVDNKLLEQTLSLHSSQEI